MTGTLKLTKQENPIAQSFRVTEPGGSVLTGVGLFFATAPTSAQLQQPVFVELRPVTESGVPSATRFLQGSRVKASAATVRAAASTTFSNSTEVKFTFREPIYVENNTEYAIVVSTSAKVGRYKLWVGTQGEHLANSTTKLVTKDLNSGVMYQSSNGTAWNKDQFTDLAFKVYRAVFNATGNTAYFTAENPPVKALGENEFTERLHRYPADPIRMVAGSPKVRVLHPAHGFLIGDKVTLSTDSAGFDSGDTINGIAGAQLLGTKTIDSADAWGYTFTAGSNATLTKNVGGTSVYATEQYQLDEFVLSAPYETPPYTSIEAGGDFTTIQSIAGNETAYTRSTDVAITLNGINKFIHPHVIASSAQENEPTKLNGDPSTIVKFIMNTSSKYVAPYVNANGASIKTHTNFIDYQDSDGYTGSNRNLMTTFDYISETEASGGTSPARYLTDIFTLEETASSIRVLVDAIKPDGTDFKIWYRTRQAGSSTRIADTEWTQFSTTVNPPNTSNYSQIGTTEMFRQFEFNVFDIADFDKYQIKITMHSTKSTNVPEFKNLRTIATA